MNLLNFKEILENKDEYKIYLVEKNIESKSDILFRLNLNIVNYFDKIVSFTTDNFGQKAKIILQSLKGLEDFDVKFAEYEEKNCNQMYELVLYKIMDDEQKIVFQRCNKKVA